MIYEAHMPTLHAAGMYEDEPQQFSTAREAWRYLADYRNFQIKQLKYLATGRPDRLIREMKRKDGPGDVHGPIPTQPGEWSSDYLVSVRYDS